jgi:hypothetical protein
VGVLLSRLRLPDRESADSDRIDRFSGASSSSSPPAFSYTQNIKYKLRGIVQLPSPFPSPKMERYPGSLFRGFGGST